MTTNYLKDFVRHKDLLSVCKKNAATWGRDCPCRGLQCGDTAYWPFQGGLNHE